jgi:hypothetical protein
LLTPWRLKRAIGKRKYIEPEKPAAGPISAAKPKSPGRLASIAKYGFNLSTCFAICKD